MKVYITTRFKGKENQAEIEALSHAVREAGMSDFNFIRDVEHYQHTFDNPKDLWARTYDELGACDALLIDVSNHPTGGRVIEVGMAYALRKRIFVVVRRGVEYKNIFDGVASTVVPYDNYKDVTAALKKYDQDSSFNINDKMLLCALLIFFGIALGWGLAQYFVPLGIVAVVGYWLLVRYFLPSMRAFDRAIIFIPLALLWLYGTGMLLPIAQPLAWAWAIMFWLVVLLVLKKMKFSL